MQLVELEKEYGKVEKLDLEPSKKEQVMLKQYFYTNVRNLENILSKDLSGIWF